ncbi:MAG: succinate dehydrogenase, cytochrome b556 subunit [Candidatus Puniceispirillaceae bacterium]
MGKARPLSPHLQIYRLPLPALLSITHRMTGVILSSGTLLLTIWLVALAGGPDSYAYAMMIVGHPLGQLILFGYSAALFYHMCNGIRHLNWDRGRGLEIESVYRSGKITIALAIGLTALLWAVVYVA